MCVHISLKTASQRHSISGKSLGPEKDVVGKIEGHWGKSHRKGRFVSGLMTQGHWAVGLVLSMGYGALVSFHICLIPTSENSFSSQMSQSCFLLSQALNQINSKHIEWKREWWWNRIHPEIICKDEHYPHHPLSMSRHGCVNLRPPTPTPCHLSFSC